MSVANDQQAYWDSFEGYARARGSRFGDRGSLNGAYHSWRMGRTGFVLAAAVYFGPRAADGGRVTLAVQGANAAADYARLAASRAAVERDLGFPVEWNEKPGQRRSSVEVTGGPSPDDRARWPELHEWLLTRLHAFDRVFGPRVRA